MYDQQRISELTQRYLTRFPDDKQLVGLAKTVSSLRDRDGIWSRFEGALARSVRSGMPLTDDDCLQVVNG